MEHPEGRETEDAEQQGAEAEHAGLADTVGDIAPEGDEEGNTAKVLKATPSMRRAPIQATIILG